MEDEADRERDDIGRPANDNCRPEHANVEDADIAPWQRVDRVVLDIARLIGRRISREQFEAVQAANDNAPPAAGAEGREKDRKTEQD